MRSIFYAPGIWLDVIDDWHCACRKHAGKGGPYAGICYLIAKIDNFIGTNLQNRPGNMANVTSGYIVNK